MDLNGEYLIPVPRERVWQALNDAKVLRAAIPGCEELVKISETEYRARVVARVGAIQATFAGAVRLSDVDPPNGYTIAGQGQGGAAGFAKGSARVSLVAQAAGTLLSYRASADVGGRLASVGNRLIQGVANKTAETFFGRFVQIVTEADAGPAAPAGLAAPPAAAPGGRWLSVQDVYIAAGAVTYAFILLLLFGR